MCGAGLPRVRLTLPRPQIDQAELLAFLPPPGGVGGLADGGDHEISAGVNSGNGSSDVQAEVFEMLARYNEAVQTTRADWEAVFSKQQITRSRTAPDQVRQGAASGFRTQHQGQG